MNHLIFVWSFAIGISFSSFAQTDSTSKEKHPYKKSMLFSAIIPGAGQIRNASLSQKKIKPAYWKVPLIYGSLGTAGYFIYQNHSAQNNVKTEYNNRLDGNPPAIEWSNYDNFGLIALQKQYLNNRDLFVLLSLAIYGIQIIDAGVEAHFLKFDVSEDLSLRIQPFILQDKAGIGFNFKFR
jgi:hypothetical protein